MKINHRQIIKYLEENCMCAPDSKGYKSVCGFKCKAEYHWRDEVKRFKLELKLMKVLPFKNPT